MRSWWSLLPFAVSFPLLLRTALASATDPWAPSPWPWVALELFCACMALGLVLTARRQTSARASLAVSAFGLGLISVATLWGDGTPSKSFIPVALGVTLFLQGVVTAFFTPPIPQKPELTPEVLRWLGGGMAIMGLLLTAGGVWIRNNG